MRIETKKRGMMLAFFLAAGAIAVLPGLIPRRQTAPPAAPAPPVKKLTPFQRIVLGDLQRQAAAPIGYRNGYYLGGEPPPNKGVCTDVVIRSFRAAGVDLQKAVTQDIRAHPGDYPIARPDANIDHRRCRNLVVFFRRHARSLPIDGEKADWQAGDLVFWDTADKGKPDHVGVIANGRDAQNFPTVIHHWPGQPVAETDGLYGWTIRNHFRYAP